MKPGTEAGTVIGDAVAPEFADVADGTAAVRDPGVASGGGVDAGEHADPSKVSSASHATRLDRFVFMAATSPCM